MLPDREKKISATFEKSIDFERQITTTAHRI